MMKQLLKRIKYWQSSPGSLKKTNQIPNHEKKGKVTIDRTRGDETVEVLTEGEMIEEDTRMTEMVETLFKAETGLDHGVEAERDQDQEQPSVMGKDLGGEIQPHVQVGPRQFTSVIFPMIVFTKLKTFSDKATKFQAKQ